ncbi:hypothetical protein [Pseudidiomarina fusca]|nr:hypothetical protein [Pseudidiomarina sp. GXY010]
MSNMNENQQADIFQALHGGYVNSPQATPDQWPAAAFAELCNALYERELQQLAQQLGLTVQGLQKRLRSLPYYIQQAARGMLQCGAPFVLDLQNASWQTPQKTKLQTAAKQTTKLSNWLHKHAKLGDAVVIHVQTQHLQKAVLDSLDRLDLAQQRVHCNHWGWFDLQGQWLDRLPAHEAAATATQAVLVLPDKYHLGAAMGGHQWGHKGKLDPRPLSLREVLLATRIQWR